MREIIDWIAGVVLILVALFIFTIGCMPGLVEEGIITLRILAKVIVCGVLAFTWVVNSPDQEEEDDENEE